MWVTHNGGASWSPLTDKQASLSIASLTLDPTDSTRRTLLAGTGLTANGFIGSISTQQQSFLGSGGLRNGLLYSQDGGTTWTSLGSGTLTNQSVVAAAARGNTLLAGTWEMSLAATNRFTGGTLSQHQWGRHFQSRIRRGRDGPSGRPSKLHHGRPCQP